MDALTLDKIIYDKLIPELDNLGINAEGVRDTQSFGEFQDGDSQGYISLTVAGIEFCCNFNNVMLEISCEHGSKQFLIDFDMGNFKFKEV